VVETPAKCLTQFAVWRTAPDPGIVAAFCCHCCRLPLHSVRFGSVQLSSVQFCFVVCRLFAALALAARNCCSACYFAVAAAAKVIKMKKPKANRLCRMQQHGNLSQLLQLCHAKLLFRHTKAKEKKNKNQKKSNRKERDEREVEEKL